MSKPAIIPETSTSGIAVDPRTLDRVIPETRRADGSLRKERKIRPGFTPQEDVSRFRGTRQVQSDANQLPKGHIIGWVPPTASPSIPIKVVQSKSAKKNEKRKEKRKERQDDELNRKIKESWDDDDDEDDAPPKKGGGKSQDRSQPSTPKAGEHKAPPNEKTSVGGQAATDALADQLQTLDVKSS